jgi:hypothetical protein
LSVYWLAYWPDRTKKNEFHRLSSYRSVSGIMTTTGTPQQLAFT